MAEDSAYGRFDVENQPSVNRRGPLLTMVRNFAPVWFTVCMNAGIIGILMHQLPEPYQFPGLQVLSTVAYMVDLILFIIFSFIFILRIILYPRKTFHEVTNNAESLSLLATWPIAYLTIVSFVSLSISQASWGGYSFTLLAYSLWWIGAAWIVGFMLFILIIVIRRAEFANQQIQPLIMLPVVGVATLSTIGGLVVSNSYNISSSLAVPVIVTCFCTIGLGLFMALPLYALILHRLFTHGFPTPESAASMFVLIGPMGQLSAALQVHGSAASTYGQFAGYGRGSFLTAEAAQPLNVVCALLGLMLVGMGTLWLLISFYYMLELAATKKLGWTMTWNSIIFPIGTLGTGCEQLAISLDSAFFRIVTSIIIVFLVLMFFVNLAFMMVGIFKGEILFMKENVGEIDKRK